MKQSIGQQQSRNISVRVFFCFVLFFTPKINRSRRLWPENCTLIQSMSTFTPCMGDLSKSRDITQRLYSHPIMRPTTSADRILGVSITEQMSAECK